MTRLATRRVGSGPPVVLIHGGLATGESAWSEQLPLAGRWTLVIVDRAGYGGSAELSDGEDFELDAQLIARGLEAGSHVVGMSSGALAALHLVALRPDAVASLTVIEPPAFHLVPESDAASALLEAFERHFDQPLGDPVDWLRGFIEAAGWPVPSDEVLAELAGAARVAHGFVTRPWEAELPLDEVAALAIPKLVISGGYSDAFEDVCDVLAARIGAERAVIRGGGHGVPYTGAPFNERLERLLTGAG